MTGLGRSMEVGLFWDETHVILVQMSVFSNLGRILLYIKFYTEPSVEKLSGFRFRSADNSLFMCVL